MKHTKPQFKVGIDASRLGETHRAGIENYAYNITEALINLKSNVFYEVYFKDWNAKTSPDFCSAVNARCKTIPTRILWTQFSLALETIKDKPDILFCPFHTVPGLVKPWQKIVSFVHGLEYRTDRKNPLEIAKLDTELQFVVTKSEAIIVPSHATKEALIKTGWKLNLQKTYVIPEGVSHIFHKRGPEEVNTIKNKYGLSNSRYFLAVSTIQPRKNYTRLIEAFSHLVKESDTPEELTLAISGKNGWDYQDVLDAPARFGIEKHVKFLGRTPDEDLPALISGGQAFVNVSLEEGFGLPLLESMSCETACVASDIKAYREVADKHAIFVNPHEAGSIKDGLSKALKGSTEDMVKEAKKRAAEFTWEEAALRTLAVFKTVLEHR